MKKDFYSSFENFIDKYKQNKKWKKVISILSCITFFLSIYLFMLPAITQNNDTTYTFHLIDSYNTDIDSKYSWKKTGGYITSYDLKLHFVDTNGNAIEGEDLTLELNPKTIFKDTPYGFGYIPQDGGKDRGLNLIDTFKIKERISSTGDKYVFDHAEVLVEGTWQKFTSDTEKHWNIWCQSASSLTEPADRNYSWRGNYEIETITKDATGNSITTYTETRYTINENTEYKIVYKLIRNGQDSVIESLGADSGITFKIFNYEGDNSKTGVNANGLYDYFTFRGIGNTDDKKINTTIDADGFTTNRAKVLANLNESGYPVFDCQGQCTSDKSIKNTSLGYLFGAQTNAIGTTTVGVTGYNPTNTPLLKETINNVEYYYYDSNRNAVDYNTDNNSFMLRNYIERSYNMTTYENEKDRYEFLPFNYWTNKILTNSSNERTYQYETNEIDHWYGMTMEFEFYMPKDGLIKDNAMKFEFSGDDDVWVFIDDVLVLDLGGTHGAVDGSINFHTGDVEGYLNWNGTKGLKNTTTIYDSFKTAEALNKVELNEDNKIFKDYTKHTLKFFYLERGASVANCKIRFNIPVLPPGSLSVQKQFIETDKYNEEHEFTIYNTTSGTKQPVPNTKYTIDGVEYYTDSNGSFKLKNTELAIFELTNYNTYYVEETAPGLHSTSYKCTLDGTKCQSINKTDELTINPESTHQAIFTNKIKTYNLKVSKIAYDSEDNETFEFKVSLKDKEELPIDIPDDINSPNKYIVDHEQGIVTFTLKNKEDITIYDIPIDTTVTLQESKHDGYQTVIKSENIILANSDTYEFKMDSDKAITVHNNPGVELPQTGSTGIVKYLILGFLLILISIKYGYSCFIKLKEGEDSK